MFNVNDTIMYGSQGVCRILDIREESFSGTPKLYYVLEPVYDANSTIYCPVDSDKISLRKLLSLAEIYELIKLMPDTETSWIENDHERKEKFSTIVKEGDHQQLILLIKTLYFNRQSKLDAGKKPHAIDERLMKDAEHILYTEFAHVLQIKPEEVLPFITGQLDLNSQGVIPHAQP